MIDNSFEVHNNREYQSDSTLIRKLGLYTDMSKISKALDNTALCFSISQTALPVKLSQILLCLIISLQPRGSISKRTDSQLRITPEVRYINLRKGQSFAMKIIKYWNVDYWCFRFLHIFCKKTYPYVLSSSFQIKWSMR